MADIKIVDFFRGYKVAITTIAESGKSITMRGTLISPLFKEIGHATVTENKRLDCYEEQCREAIVKALEVALIEHIEEMESEMEAWQYG